MDWPTLLAEPDPTPPPQPSRVAVDWAGPEWTEYDPATGEVIASGRLPDRPTGRLA